MPTTLGTSLLLCFSTLLGLTTSACASSGFSNGVFRDGDVHFGVGPVPNNWKLITTETADDGLANFAFRDETNAITVGAAGRCDRDGDDVPLRALTQHLTIGFTDRSITGEQELQLDGRAALRTELTASLDGVPTHLVFVVIKKDRCVYDFWWIAPSNAASVEPFDRFVAGFHTVS